MCIRVFVPSRLDIASSLERLAALVRNADAVAEVEQDLRRELIHLECDVANRAGIDVGRLSEA